MQSLSSRAVHKMGFVEQASKYLVGFELRLLMGCRLDHVLEVVIVALSAQMNAIRRVAVCVFVQHGTLRQGWRGKFGETLEVGLVAATNM